jgi:hypothetical protein
MDVSTPLTNIVLDLPYLNYDRFKKKGEFLATTCAVVMVFQ